MKKLKFWQAGAVIKKPTFGLLGENPATVPELVSPVELMRKTFEATLRGFEFPKLAFEIPDIPPVFLDVRMPSLETLQATIAMTGRQGQPITKVENYYITNEFPNLTIREETDINKISRQMAEATKRQLTAKGAK